MRMLRGSSDCGSFRYATTMFDDDIFDEDGALTASYLASRGYCCGNGCRNCPYTPRHGGLDAELRPDRQGAGSADEEAPIS